MNPSPAPASNSPCANSWRGNSLRYRLALHHEVAQERLQAPWRGRAWEKTQMGIISELRLIAPHRTNRISFKPKAQGPSPASFLLFETNHSCVLSFSKFLPPARNMRSDVLHTTGVPSEPSVSGLLRGRAGRDARLQRYRQRRRRIGIYDYSGHVFFKYGMPKTNPNRPTPPDIGPNPDVHSSLSQFRVCPSTPHPLCCQNRGPAALHAPPRRTQAMRPAQAMRPEQATSPALAMSPAPGIRPASVPAMGSARAMSPAPGARQASVQAMRSAQAMGTRSGKAACSVRATRSAWATRWGHAKGQHGPQGRRTAPVHRTP